MTTVLLAVLLWLPQAGNGEFTISANGARVGTEQFSVSENRSGFLATGRTRFQINGETVEAESRMQLDSDLNPVSYEYQSGDRSLRMEIGDPATEVRVTVGGEVTSYEIIFPAGAMIVDDNFFHHYQLLMDRLGENGGFIEVFVPQQLTVGTLEMRPLGDGTYDLITENLRLRVSTDSEGRLVRLVGPDSGIVVER